MTTSDGGRRALQITLGAVAAIPFASGLAGALLGPASLPGAGGAVTPEVENEYRYTHAVYAAVGPLVWAALPRIEREGALVRAVSGALFVGGATRLLAWRAAGKPHPALVGAAALELLGTPVLVAWQRRVAARAHRL
ncbi:DUF4345 domain-containing protein [Blastococcus sp. TF02A-35]|uniref:DUF4345 domain-containing protein n=1 Tax=Blastococcus sp. TF02A-35 TaxID=2559612 RepID=UPI001074619B|nr:DUF4345 domain-containing protein [Blastococcus sp. TF02A_35]TFV48912.1 DUF4345 domain-containing protein [Blastococcus sp. TF02A_35]